MVEVMIRPEQSGDFGKITVLIDEAFAGMPYAGGDESEVVLRLRQQNALSLGLLAEVDGELVGHIAFSPVKADDGSSGWFALGPVAVFPQFQSMGIGGKLITEGLRQIQGRGGVGCMLTGNPDYYRRFGFEFSAGNCPPNETAEYFMIKRLTDAAAPAGALHFHPAFYSD
ncbi:MAG: GNAT family N-acetyltransferase [Pseudomonadales bacterium]